MTFLVHINGRVYAVGDADVAHVESQILAAVHAGGGFIDLDGAGDRPTRALVSPASWVRIEKLPQPVDSPEKSTDFPDLAFLSDLDL